MTPSNSLIPCSYNPSGNSNYYKFKYQNMVKNSNDPPIPLNSSTLYLNALFSSQYSLSSSLSTTLNLYS